MTGPGVDPDDVDAGGLRRSCADIETLILQDRLFVGVCSDTTLYRTFTQALDADTVGQARRAMAGVRAEVWRRTAATGGDGAVVLDVDASLVEVHSENKDGAAAYCTGGFGFYRASSSSGAVTTGRLL